MKMQFAESGPAQPRHASRVRQCLLVGVKRKTFPPREYFRVWSTAWLRCDAAIRPVLRVKRTLREHRETDAVDPKPTSRPLPLIDAVALGLIRDLGPSVSRKFSSLVRVATLHHNSGQWGCAQRLCQRCSRNGPFLTKPIAEPIRNHAVIIANDRAAARNVRSSHELGTTSGKQAPLVLF
jgi:hypothetical protein